MKTQKTIQQSDQNPGQDPIVHTGGQVLFRLVAVIVVIIAIVLLFKMFVMG